MKKVSTRVTALLLALATGLGGTASTVVFAERTAVNDTAAAPIITILPIDRATVLAGQKLDFRVEVTGLSTTSDPLQVLINGKDASTYFGKKPVLTHTTKNSTEYTIRDIAFNTPGQVSVQATSKNNGKMISKTVKYDVYQAIGDTKKAKNVVLMVGDGMSANIRTAARVISKGINEGKFNGWLEMEKMDSFGVVTTSGMDSIVTDSANSASAYATGHKTAVNAEGVYPDNTPDPLDDPKVENIIELVKRTRGMSTGLVTTADITDATPAAMASHTRSRYESEFIANSYLDPARSPDVLLGGGREWFLPEQSGGKRKDNNNLIDAYRKEGYSYVSSASELTKAKTNGKLIGLFRPGNMNVYFDREYTKPNNPAIVGEYKDQPTLMEMTSKALSILDKNKNGFFLMVEGASIDKQAHTMDMERLLWDTIEFDQTVGLVKEYVRKHPDTLVIVTADHGHSMTLNGTFSVKEAAGKTGEELREFIGTYADSKFPTYTDKNEDGFPDDPDTDWKLALGWGNHPDYNENYLTNQKPISPTIQDPTVTDKSWYIANPDKDPDGIHYNGNLPHDEGQEVHTFDDVPISASGAGSSLFSGYMDNTEVFRKIMIALQLDAVKENVKK